MGGVARTPTAGLLPCIAPFGVRTHGARSPTVEPVFVLLHDFVSKPAGVDHVSRAAGAVSRRSRGQHGPGPIEPTFVGQIGQHPGPAGTGEKMAKNLALRTSRFGDRSNGSGVHHRAPQVRRARRRFGDAAVATLDVAGCKSCVVAPCGETEYPKLELFRPGPIRAASGAKGPIAGCASGSASPPGERRPAAPLQAGPHAALRRRHRPREVREHRRFRSGVRPDTRVG
jgi:hypothetical protein